MNLRGLAGTGYNVVVNSVLSNIEVNSPDISKMLDNIGNTVCRVLGTIIESAPMEEIRSKVLNPLLENKYLNELGASTVWVTLMRLFCKAYKNRFNTVVRIREELMNWVSNY